MAESADRISSQKGSNGCEIEIRSVTVCFAVPKLGWPGA
jgi:hypothetical protein